MDRRKLVLGVLAVAACSPTTPPPTMPAAAPGSVTADPIRSAMLEAAGYFRRPQPNQPAATARAIADIEFLAEAVPRDPRWQASPAQALTQLQQARSTDRFIRRSLDAHAGVDLALGLDHRREVVLVGGAGRLKKLGSRDTHRRGLP